MANPIWTRLRTSSRLLCSFLYAEFYPFWHLGSPRAHRAPRGEGFVENQRREVKLLSCGNFGVWKYFQAPHTIFSWHSTPGYLLGLLFQKVSEYHPGIIDAGFWGYAGKSWDTKPLACCHCMISSATCHQLNAKEHRQITHHQPHGGAKETKEQCVFHIISFSCLLFFALQARSMAGDRQFSEIELALSYSRHAYCVS